MAEFDPGATSVIFVSGAFHTEFHCQPCISPFQKAGYRIIPCPLLANGTYEPPPTFVDEVERIKSLLAAEINAGQKVCLIGHSAGGLPVCETATQYLATATDEEKKKLQRIIFVASILNREKAIEAKLGEGWTHLDIDKRVVTCSNSAQVFYNDLSTTESQPFVDALVPMAMQFDTPSSVSTDLWKQVPRTYMLCLRDNTIPIKFQRIEIEENEWEAVEIDSDHCPFVGQPEKFVSTVDQILRS